MRELISVEAPAFLLPPAVYNADNTPVVIDLASYDAASIFVMVGVGGITFSATNKVEFKLSHGDTATAGEHAAVAQADIFGVTVGAGGIIRSLVAAHAAPSIVKAGYLGMKRYLSLLADFDGTHGTGTPMSVIVVRQLPLTGPVA